MAKTKMSKTSRVVVIALFALAIAACVALWLSGASQGGEYEAVIHDGDGGETTLELGECCSQTVTVSTSLGENVVVVDGSEVYVESADCPNHDCMSQGRISQPGEQIVCLPHRLWIEIIAKGDAPSTESVEEAAASMSDSDSYDAVAR